MPTTYTPLQTTTLGSSQASVTLSGISGSYTDLVVVVSAQGTSAGNDQDINMTFNSDTATNYSRTRLYGNGSSALSTRDSNVSSITIGNMPAASSTLGSGNSIIQINSYSNTSINKTALIRTNTSSTYGTVFAIVGLWRNTAAITSITFTPAGGNFATGSTFTLYGVSSAAVVSNGAKATGGDTIATDGTYWYHAFKSSGTFTPTQTLSCDYLVVAGGGGTGQDYGGGGGAGGFRVNTAQSFGNGTAYTITVGAGGSAGSASAGGSKGANSSIAGSGMTTFSATGGGGGMSWGSNQNGGTTGGSGGGASAQGTGKAGNEGGYTPVEGFAGGNGGASNGSGAGGGGATAVGNNGGSGTSSIGGAGGAGSSAYSSWGLATGTGQNVSGTVWFAGGGGGASGNLQSSTGPGGNGGGGNGGGGSNATAATAGRANTGGGAGGGAANNGAGAAGGSGLVIVRYPV